MSIFFAFVAIIHFAVFVFGIYFFIILSQKANFTNKNYRNFVFYFVFYLSINIITTQLLSHVTDNAKVGSIAYSALPFMILLLSVLSYAVKEIFKINCQFMSIMFAIIISAPVTLFINLILHDYLVQWGVLL